jgi:hypothetical protein
VIKECFRFLAVPLKSLPRQPNTFVLPPMSVSNGGDFFQLKFELDVCVCKCVCVWVCVCVYVRVRGKERMRVLVRACMKVSVGVSQHQIWKARWILNFPNERGICIMEFSEVLSWEPFIDVLTHHYRTIIYPNSDVLSSLLLPLCHRLPHVNPFTQNGKWNF